MGLDLKKKQRENTQGPSSNFVVEKSEMETAWWLSRQKGLLASLRNQAQYPESDDGRKKEPLKERLFSEIHVHCSMCVPAFTQCTYTCKHYYTYINLNCFFKTILKIVSAAMSNFVLNLQLHQFTFLIQILVIFENHIFIYVYVCGYPCEQRAVQV